MTEVTSWKRISFSSSRYYLVRPVDTRQNLCSSAVITTGWLRNTSLTIHRNVRMRCIASLGYVVWPSCTSTAVFSNLLYQRHSAPTIKLETYSGSWGAWSTRQVRRRGVEVRISSPEKILRKRNSEILRIHLSVMCVDMLSIFMYLKILGWICRYGELSPYSEQ